MKIKNMFLCAFAVAGMQANPEISQQGNFPDKKAMLQSSREQQKKAILDDMLRFIKQESEQRRDPAGLDGAIESLDFKKLEEGYLACIKEERSVTATRKKLFEDLQEHANSSDDTKLACLVAERSKIVELQDKIEMIEILSIIHKKELRNSSIKVAVAVGVLLLLCE